MAPLQNIFFIMYKINTMSLNVLYPLLKPIFYFLYTMSLIGINSRWNSMNSLFKNWNSLLLLCYRAGHQLQPLEICHVFRVQVPRLLQSIRSLGEECNNNTSVWLDYVVYKSNIHRNVNQHFNLYHFFRFPLFSLSLRYYVIAIYAISSCIQMV